jgi:hypothetical protein
MSATILSAFTRSDLRCCIPQSQLGGFAIVTLARLRLQPGLPFQICSQSTFPAPESCDLVPHFAMFP